jgi:hypothetical protein|nr:MAG TPA: hypothetical protein [Caudoviricetes sp.]
MAKKRKTEKQEGCCALCVHSYDWHEKDYKGEFFLCRCPFHKWSKFLYRDWCEHFQKKG